MPLPPLLLQALSDAHTYLFEELERLLALQAENDGLRLQEVEDRARIKQLLALTRPVEQKVVYGSGSSAGGSGGGSSSENGPHCNAVFPRGEGRGRAQRAAGATARPGGPPPPAPPPERILRTVYLPTAQAEVMSLKCEALQAQLAEQRRFAAERIAALQEDRSIRERDAAAHAAVQAANIEDLADKLRGAEEALRRTTRDYILARQQRDGAQQEAARRGPQRRRRSSGGKR
jgi:coiled-coil domain-containing protein 77